MPRVTIQEASRILNVSQDVIRRDVRDGKLQASKEGGPNGSRWMVDVPDNLDDYTDELKENIHALAQSITPWWYDNPNKRGFVHYLESLGIEEVEPFFLCGLRGNDIFPATGHETGDRCQECILEAMAQGLPMETRE
jgi:hypothetical protein